MKQNLLLFTLLLFTFSAFSQTTDFSKIDSLARNFRKKGFPNPTTLAQALCKDLKTDREKARALFTWITANVRYDFKALDDDLPTRFNSAAELNAYIEKTIQRTYDKGKGVCRDYSRLYQKMANAAGLECEYIGGHAKSSVKGGWNSHAWNAVKIEGYWGLIDATWGSGQSKGDGKFHEIFQPGYFLTEPRIFLTDHLPDDPKWQLVDKAIEKNEFKKRPAFDYGDPEHDIADVAPFEKPIEKGTDGKMEFRVKMKHPSSVFRLHMGTKDIVFDQNIEDGWVVFRFTPNYGDEVQLWGGEEVSNGILTSLIGVFPVKSAY